MSECRVARRSGVRGRACQRPAPDGDEPSPPSSISTQECTDLVCLPAARGSREAAATKVQAGAEATRRGAERDDRQGLAAEAVRAPDDGYRLAAAEQLEPAVNGLGAHHDERELVGLLGVGAAR